MEIKAIYGPKDIKLYVMFHKPVLNNFWMFLGASSKIPLTLGNIVTMKKYTWSATVFCKVLHVNMTSTQVS